MQDVSHPGERRAEKIETNVERLLDMVMNLPKDRLYATPAPTEWSAMMILAHVAELVPYWARQAADVASRTEMNLPFGRTHDDPDRIAAVDNHAADTLDMVVPRIRQGTHEAVRLLRAIPPEKWRNTARHARRGEMTIEQIVDQFLLDHLVEHVDQAKSLLGRK